MTFNFQEMTSAERTFENPGVTNDTGYVDGNLRSMEPSPEAKTIVNDLLGRLTAESKFVLYTIFNTPGELSKMMFGDTASKGQIRKYLKCLGWERTVINKTVKEVAKFSGEILS